MAGFYVSAKYFVDLPDLVDEDEITQTSLDIEGLSSMNAEGDLVFNGVAYSCLEVVVDEIEQ